MGVGRDEAMAAGLLSVLAACRPAPTSVEGAGSADSPVVEVSTGGRAKPLHPAAHRVVYVALEGPSAIEAVPRGAKIDGTEGRRLVRARLAQLATDHAAMRGRLEALGATVVADLRRVANTIQIVAAPGTLDRIRRLPGVAFVEHVPVHRPSLTRGLDVVGAPVAWASPLTGQGVRVGIIDSGIDYLHAAFGGPGTPAAYQADDRTLIEPGSFPTARVVGGVDLSGDDYDPSEGEVVPAPDDDPLDCGGHGSHVAGIAGSQGVLQGGAPYTGPYDQSFDPLLFQLGPGVAPEADLYAIKVFGCRGSTQLLVSALEYAADPDGDGDLSDRLDVVNASLGTSYGLTSAVNGQAVRNLHAAGTLVVASAGNAGPTFFSTSAPAHFPEALSVAATYAGGFVTLAVNDSSAAGEYAGAEAVFAPSLDQGSVTGAVVAAEPAGACSSLEDPSALAGAIAYVRRGGCSFVSKFQRVEAAGAVGVVLANDDFDAGISTMQGSGTTAIPGVMISAADAVVLESALATEGFSATLSGALFGGEGAELMAGLSARGPTAPGGRLKPEIAAPGLGIDSVDVGSGAGADDKSGTSMASPFVAGAAALVRQAHPSWGPAATKEALMASARLLADGAGATYAMSQQGAGRLDVAAAVHQEVTLAASADPDAVALSLGGVVADEPTSIEAEFTVSNRSAMPVSLSVAAEQVHALPGVVATVAPKSMQIAAGSSAVGTLTLSFDPEALGDPVPDPVTPTDQFDLPRHWLHEADGTVLLGGDVEAVLPFHAAVRAGARRRAGEVTGCAGEGQIDRIALEGPSAHPRPVVTALELGVTDDAAAGADTDPSIAAADIRAIGAASDVARVSAFDEATVFFGVAVAGTWNTPAVPGRPAISVEIDTDDDGEGDIHLVPEPLGYRAPYADVLAATSYQTEACDLFDFANCPQDGSKRYLNALPADVAPTHPYLNGVVLLPVFARDLGLSADAARVRYRAIALRMPEGFEATEWATFDAARPALDTVPREGARAVPVYSSGEEVVVRRGPGADDAQVLLLHHANVESAAGELLRHEVVAVEVSAASSELTVAAPSDVVATEAFEATITVANLTGAVVEEAEVVVGATGAVLMEVKGGACVGERCAVDLPAHGSAVLTVRAMASEGSEARIEAALSTPEGCTQVGAATASVGAAVEPVVSAPAAGLVPTGGCGCRASEPSGERRGWLLGLGLALATFQRRRRTP